MDTETFVRNRVNRYYWEKDLNCATTDLLILAEKFGVELSGQVVDAALGMHGAGNYGAQCGLVEGTLMFLGIIGRRRRLGDDDISNGCNAFAGAFEKHFSSLMCSVLRPEGFSEQNPPHLCERLSCRAICFNIEFVRKLIGRLESSHPDSR